MKYNHDKIRAQGYMDKALKQIKSVGLSPTPDNVELWYVYFAGVNMEVKRALDVVLENKQKVEQSHCSDIYDRFLSSLRREDMVREAGNKIQRTIEEMSDFMADIKNNASTFSGTLEDASQKMGAASSIEELENMMGNLIQDTRKMIEHNMRLEQELDRSSHQMLELQNDLEMVRKEVYTDGLTGLKNRKAFDEEIIDIIEQSNKENKPFSLLMVDIDHFKHFNDSYGHQVGDQVLRLVAKSLTDGIKGRDSACRFGGEEFAIILPNTDNKGAGIVADALRKTISTKEIVNKITQEKLGKITISIGVAEYKQDEEYEHLVERADAALYTAKRTGRNRVATAPDKLFLPDDNGKKSAS